LFEHKSTKNQGTSLHDKCLLTSLQHIISQIHDIVRWICCQKWNKDKKGNTSKLTKSSNYLYKCNIFSKTISKNAIIRSCTVGLSFKSNWHKIYSITQHQARQQIPQKIVGFSKIRAILNRYGLILYQVNISRNKKNWLTNNYYADNVRFGKHGEFADMVQNFYLVAVL